MKKILFALSIGMYAVGAVSGAEQVINVKATIGAVCEIKVVDSPKEVDITTANKTADISINCNHANGATITLTSTKEWKMENTTDATKKIPYIVAVTNPAKDWTNEAATTKTLNLTKDEDNTTYTLTFSRPDNYNNGIYDTGTYTDKITVTAAANT